MMFQLAQTMQPSDMILWQNQDYLMLVLATNHRDPRNLTNQFTSHKLNPCQDFRWNPTKFDPQFQTKIDTRFLVQSAQFSLYLVDNFKCYKMKKNSIRWDKNLHTNFGSKFIGTRTAVWRTGGNSQISDQIWIESLIDSIRHQPIPFIAMTSYCRLQYHKI
jgi:hypothetical protein